MSQRAWLLASYGLLACGSGGDIRLFPQTAPIDLPPAPTRSAVLAPYASTSIWNTALGDQAALKKVALKPASAGIRTEAVALLLNITDPPLSVQHSDAGWTGADRCPGSLPEHFTAYSPANFLVLEGEGKRGTPLVALQADGRSLKQGLPMARCEPGSPATIGFEEPDEGGLYGDGLSGANGGSGLSALGGVLRLGELLPGVEPPRHVLAIHVHSNDNLWAAAISADCFRWPAGRADDYCVGTYGGNETELRMGALLALPVGMTPTLRTAAAQKLAWTLQNYGAYIVNDAGSPSYAFNVELSPAGWFVDEFEAAWGFPFQTTDMTSDWAEDVQALFDALSVVTDNTPSHPGGAGARLQPPLPLLAQP